MDCPSYMYRYRGRLVKRHEHYSYAAPSLLFINSLLLPLSPNPSNSPLFHPHVSLFPFLFSSLNFSTHPTVHPPINLSLFLHTSYPHLSTHLQLYPPLSLSLSLHLTPPLHPPPTLFSHKSSSFTPAPPLPHPSQPHLSTLHPP